MEKQVERRTRLLALWHLRQGRRIEEVMQLLSVSYRIVQNWLRWYRHGGLDEVLQRIRGYGSSGAHSAYLTPLQRRALFAKVQLGELRTVWDAADWVQTRWGVNYTYKGMHDLLYRHDCAPKVPRPQSSKADPQRQEQWKRGLAEQLVAAGWPEISTPSTVMRCVLVCGHKSDDAGDARG